MARTKQYDTKVAEKTPRSFVARKTTMGGKSMGGSKTQPKHRFRPGTLALREIRKYQKSSDLLIRKRPFQRVVRQLMPTFTTEGIRFQSASLVILQEALENFLVSLLEDAYRCSVHAKRVTLLPRDIVLVYKIKYSKLLTTAMV
ncbi:histone H3 [Pancytospora epiphaga]|nr:histone H3 [Pancytospora epiphaga]